MTKDEIQEQLADKYYAEDAMCKSDLYDLMDEYDKLLETAHNSDYAKLPSIDELKSYMHRHKYLPDIVGTLAAIKKLANFA